MVIEMSLVGTATLPESALQLYNLPLSNSEMREYRLNKAQQMRDRQDKRRLRQEQAEQNKRASWFDSVLERAAERKKGEPWRG